MKNITKQLRKQNVNIRTFITSLLILVFGLSLITITEWLPLLNHLASSLFNTVGLTLVGSSIIAFIWELAVKRAFLKEILAEVNISENLSNAGIEQVVTSFSEIDWKSFYENARYITFVLFHSTHTMSVNRNYILAANKEGVPITLYLPNPKNTNLMKQLSILDGEENEQLIILKVEESIKQFSSSTGAKIILLNEMHQFCMYQTDKVAIIALNKEVSFKNPILIVSKKGGHVYKYCSNYLEKFQESIVSKIKTISNQVDIQ
jgi:hypothetical protein